MRQTLKESVFFFTELKESVRNLNQYKVSKKLKPQIKLKT
jgi:hypothetical protein